MTSFGSQVNGATRYKLRAHVFALVSNGPPSCPLSTTPCSLRRWNHLPFMLEGADVSFTFEQQIPLSGIRGHRRASALADVNRLRAETNRATLDVGLQAANAFLMLQERRRTAGLVSGADPVCARHRQRRECPICQRNRPSVRRASGRGRSGPARGPRPLPRERSARRRSDAQHEPCARSGRARPGARIPHIRTAASPLVGHQGGLDVPTGTCRWTRRGRPR